jgi:hypothetical protein
LQRLQRRGGQELCRSVPSCLPSCPVTLEVSLI